MGIIDITTFILCLLINSGSVAKIDPKYNAPSLLELFKIISAGFVITLPIIYKNDIINRLLMTKPINNMLYLGDWVNMKDILTSFKSATLNSDGHNPNCIIDCQTCSTEMAADVNNLCLWHRYRIGSHTQISCNCKSHTCVLGDTRAKQLAVKYYNLDYESLPVITQDSQFQCCYNYSKSEFTKCGIMLVCKDHLHGHDFTRVKVKNDVFKS